MILKYSYCPGSSKNLEEKFRQYIVTTAIKKSWGVDDAITVSENKLIGFNKDGNPVYKDAYIVKKVGIPN